MRKIITVTESRSMRGRFLVSANLQNGKKTGVEADVTGTEAAAAQAMSYAVRAGASGYQIFAPAAVLLHIPTDMRGKP